MAERLPNGLSMAGHIIDGVLGQGGFGITYRAVDRASGENFAIKEYFPSDYAVRNEGCYVSARPERKREFQMGLSAFLEEAEILRQLPRKRGLVRVRSAFTKYNTAYCVMEFIQGDSLDRMVQRLLQKHGAVPEELLVSLVDDMSAALSAVHGAGLVHRDVKPANIMIRMDGQPILIDFGAARPVEDERRLASMFTRKYAAIEQFPLGVSGLKAPLQEGPWSDIFALSVILYEIVSQGLPLPADERFRQEKKTGRDPYLPVAQNMKRNRIASQYSDRFLNAIDMGCSLMPQVRPSNANSFYVMMSERPKAASRSAYAKEGIQVQKTPRQNNAQVGKGRARKDGQRKKRGAIVMFAIIIALALLAAVYGILTPVG